MPKSIWSVIADLYPHVVRVLPHHFVGADTVCDAISVRDPSGKTTVLYTRAEIDDNLHTISNGRDLSMNDRLQAIKDADHG